jgi:hypothetical protein
MSTERIKDVRMRVTRYILLLSLLAFAFANVPTVRVSGGEDKLCPVHHVPLQKEKLKIIYGLVVDPCDNFDRATSSEKYFPYANSVIYGGCIITSDSPNDQEVLYCPKCREVEKTWPCIETRDTAIITTLPPPRVTRLPTRP